MTKLRQNLEALLAKGQESASLRFAIASHCMEDEDWDAAIEHLEVAVGLDPDYSAAWKLLGKALTGAGRPADALVAYRRGMEVAERRGDMQALKEMRVFARRIEAQLG